MNRIADRPLGGAGVAVEYSSSVPTPRPTSSARALASKPWDSRQGNQQSELS
jgi:hypothetical protein